MVRPRSIALSRAIAPAALATLLAVTSAAPSDADAGYAAKLLAGPPDEIMHSSRSVVDLETCILTKNDIPKYQQQIPGGTRIIFNFGIAIMDVTAADNGSNVAVRAVRMPRARFLHSARSCLEVTP